MTMMIFIVTYVDVDADVDDHDDTEIVDDRVFNSLLWILEFEFSCSLKCFKLCISSFSLLRREPVFTRIIPKAIAGARVVPR